MSVLQRLVHPLIGLARNSLGRRIARRKLGISSLKPLTRHAIETGYEREPRRLVWRVFREAPRLRMPTLPGIHVARKENPREILESETLETMPTATEFEPTPAFGRDELPDVTVPSDDTLRARSETQPAVQTRQPSRPIQIRTKVEEMTPKAVTQTLPDRSSTFPPEKTPMSVDEAFELPTAPRQNLVSPTTPAGEPMSQLTMVESVSKPATVEPVSEPSAIEPVSEPTVVKRVYEPSAVEPMSGSSAIKPLSQPSTMEPPAELQKQSVLSEPRVEINLTTSAGEVRSPAPSPLTRSETNVDRTSPEQEHLPTPTTKDSPGLSLIIGLIPPTEKPTNLPGNVMQADSGEPRPDIRRLAPHVPLPMVHRVLPAKQAPSVVARESDVPAADWAHLGRTGELVRRPMSLQRTQRIPRIETRNPLTFVRPMALSRQTRFDQNASAEMAESEAQPTPESPSEIARPREVASPPPSLSTLLRRQEQSDVVPTPLVQTQRELPPANLRTRRSMPNAERQVQVSSVENESFVEPPPVEDKHFASLALDSILVQRSPAVETESAEPAFVPTPSARGETSPTTVSSPTASAGMPTEGAPGVDLDTMARQVYQILRRRLRVEFERRRGWSG